jgi:hypothetical protein
MRWIQKSTAVADMEVGTLKTFEIVRSPSFETFHYVQTLGAHVCVPLSVKIALQPVDQTQVEPRIHVRSARRPSRPSSSVVVDIRRQLTS